MTATLETVLTVHQNANGYWYIGAGRSIAEGPYREPQQLLAVASDLLASALKWRIEVFDLEGKKIIDYRSDDTDVRALGEMRGHAQWLNPKPGSRH